MIRALEKPSSVYARKIAPSLADFLKNPLDERLANNLATAINDHTEWTYRYYFETDQSRLFGDKSLTQFRQEAFRQCHELQIMWDIADANKHRFLTRTSSFRTVSLSTAAYAIEDGELRITGYPKPFREAADAAARYWKQWSD